LQPSPPLTRLALGVDPIFKFARAFVCEDVNNKQINKKKKHEKYSTGPNHCIRNPIAQQRCGFCSKRPLDRLSHYDPQNVHLIGSVTTTDTGTSARACGKLAGLGNADVTITLTGSATVDSMCTNPAGNVAPGQAQQVVTGSIIIKQTDIKNGTVSFCLSTADPACSTAKECGCPNNNWTATIFDVEFGELLLTVVQSGKVVLQTTVNTQQ
jgi:hypothetical protein